MVNPKEDKLIRLRLVKSTNSCQYKHKLCVNALGLRKLNDMSTLKDSPSVRGLINRVNFLVRIEN